MATIEEAALKVAKLSSPARKTWQDHRRELLEIEAEAINAAVIALEHIEGLFDTKGTMSQVHSTLEILRLEVSNRLKAAEVSTNG